MDSLASKKWRKMQIRRAMHMLRGEGRTYQSIGDLFGVSRERVRQIVNGHRSLCPTLAEMKAFKERNGWTAGAPGRQHADPMTSTARVRGALGYGVAFRRINDA